MREEHAWINQLRLNDQGEMKGALGLLLDPKHGSIRTGGQLMAQIWYFQQKATPFVKAAYAQGLNNAFCPRFGWLVANPGKKSGTSCWLSSTSIKCCCSIHRGLCDILSSIVWRVAVKQAAQDSACVVRCSTVTALHVSCFQFSHNYSGVTLSDCSLFDCWQVAGMRSGRP